MHDIITKESSAVLATLVGNIEDGILITDEVGRIVYYNDAAVNILDLPRKSAAGGRNGISGQFFDDLCQIYNVVTYEKLESPIKRVLSQNQPISVGLSLNAGIWRRFPAPDAAADDKPPENEAQAADGNPPDGGEQTARPAAPGQGTVAYLSATCSPIIGSDGVMRGCSAIFRDITRKRKLEITLQESQQYLQTIFSAVTFGICVLDDSGRIIDLNLAAKKLFRAASKRAKGAFIGNAFHCPFAFDSECGSDPGCASCRLKKGIDTAKAKKIGYSAHFIYPMRQSDGHNIIWLNVIITNVSIGERKQILLSLIDISERKRHEAETEAARIAAELANAAKNQFLANMSHELRTPLNGVIGMLDLVLRSELTAHQRENLGIAKHSSVYLLKLINNILDFSRLESGALRLVNLRYDFIGAVREIIAKQRKDAEAKGLYIKQQLSPNLPLYVQGDALRVKQVLLIFLSNAIKFTNEGGITVRVSRGMRGVQPSLEFSVSDTGIGMVPDDIKKLFKPFSQIDGSLTRRFGGVGLGLRIAKQLVSLMSGDVSVTSTAGEGSVFSFWFPLVLADSADEVIRSQSVYLNTQPPAISPADSSDVDDLLKHCLAKLA